MYRERKETYREGETDREREIDRQREKNRVMIQREIEKIDGPLP